MRAIDHVSITVRDLRTALPFYDAVFGALRLKKVYERTDAVGYGERNRPGDDGAPGLRPHYHEQYYAAFLEDPEGNRIEAVCHHGGEDER